MSLKRSFLREILSNEELSDNEKIKKIIDGHMETVIPLQDEIDNKKAEITELKQLEKELSQIKKDNYKEQFEQIKAEYESYKNDVSKQKSHNDRLQALNNGLKEAGISDKYIKSILKVIDINNIEFDADNCISNKEKFKELITNEYSDFIEQQGKQGIPRNDPPIDNADGAFNLLPLNEKMAYANQHPDAIEVVNWLKQQ